MDINELSGIIIIDAAYQIHRELGPGLYETVYEALLARELNDRGLNVQRQVPVPLIWKGISFEEAFRADLIVRNDENPIIVEVKSVVEIVPAHEKQLLTYLRLLDFRLGLLLNFGAAYLRDGIRRRVNRL